MFKPRKIRLYRGPFDGKVLDHRDAGMNEIVIRGPKKMSRKQKYEWYMDTNNLVTALNGNGFPSPQLPITTARYTLVMLNYRGISVPCYHPDGSLFYEWDQPRRKNDK